MPTDGQVDVAAGSGELAAPVALPTGSFGSMVIPQITTLTVHYRKSEGGPDSVSITVTATPV